MTQIKSISLWVIPPIIAFIVLWFLVTQPTTVKNPQHWNSSVNQDILKTHVKMLSEQLPERSPDVDKLDRSAGYIYNQLSKYTTNIEYQPFSVWGIDYRNVIATFGPTYTDRMYVVGAHYDSYNGLPGADDNASGVAGLIELGRLFSQDPPPVTIQLVAYALEEPPYFATTEMGSFHHAKSLRNKSTNVALMISLEMIGYYTDESGSQDFPISILQYTYSDIGNFIAVVGGIGEAMHTRFFKKNMILATPLPVYSINAHPLLVGVNFSDHLNFWNFDYPAIMITDTAFYRNKNYHSKDDTWEKLDYKRMAMVVQGVHQSLVLHMKNN